MNTVKKIGRNISVIIFAQILSYILSFFFFIYTARYLGAEQFGTLSFAIALATIFIVFTDLGLRQFITREIARDKLSVKKYLSNAIGIKSLLIIISLIILFLFINLIDNSKAIVYIISFSIIFNGFSQLFYGLFQAYERLEFEAIGRILNNSILFIGCLIVITYNLSFLILALIYSLASGITFFYNFFISFLFNKTAIEKNFPFWKDILKEALPFGIVGVFGTLLHWIDTVMLSIMKGDLIVGWYNAAYRIFFIILFIAAAFDTAVFPVMSRLYKSSKESLLLAKEKTFKYLTLTGIPIGVGGMLLADKIILLTLGEEYSPSIAAFKILIWSATLVFMGTSFSTLLNSINKQLVLAKIITFSTIINIMLNIVLIPSFGYIGASIATVISLLIILLSVIIALSKTDYKISLFNILNPVIKSFVAALVMAIFIIFFKEANLLLLLPFSILIYSISIFIIKGIEKEDIEIIKKAISL